jgi:bacteriocin biosynthesis cyclodehydratase domain-containing protein
MRVPPSDASIAYVVAAGIDVVILDDNEVLFKFGSRSAPEHLARDPDRRGVLGGIVQEFLRGPRRIPDLLEAAGMTSGDELLDVIQRLVDIKVLAPEQQSAVDQYLSYTYRGHTALETTSVTILGCGPLGGRIADSLMQHGVGRMRLWDDRYADSQWESSWPAPLKHPDAECDDGTLLVHEALQASLARSGRSVSLVTGGVDDAEVESAIGESDLTIVAFEQPRLSILHRVNRLCLSEGRPWLMATVDGNLGQAGPLFAGNNSSCFNCLEALRTSTLSADHVAKRFRQHIARSKRSFFAALPSYADIVAGYTALAAVQHLIGRGAYLQSRLLTINFEHMFLDVEDVLKLPRCPVCGQARSMYRPAFPPEVVG